MTLEYDQTFIESTPRYLQVNGKHCKSYPPAGQVFPCHDSMLRISSQTAWLAFFSFLLTWVVVMQVSLKLQRYWDGQVRDMTQHRLTLARIPSPLFLNIQFNCIRSQSQLYLGIGRGYQFPLLCLTCTCIANDRILTRSFKGQAQDWEITTTATTTDKYVSNSRRDTNRYILLFRTSQEFSFCYSKHDQKKKQKNKREKRAISAAATATAFL